MLIRNFTNIQLSLKALKIALENQLKHSQENYLFASDIDLSLIFIENLKGVLKSINDLFGNLLNKVEIFVQLENGIISE